MEFIICSQFDCSTYIKKTYLDTDWEPDRLVGRRRPAAAVLGPPLDSVGLEEPGVCESTVECTPCSHLHLPQVAGSQVNPVLPQVASETFPPAQLLPLGRPAAGD